MVFVPSLTTFVISDLLGGSKILLIGNVIEQEFKQGSNWHTGSGLSLVLMIFIIASMALIAKYDKMGREQHFDKERSKRIYLVLICLILYAPIVTLMVLSFNNTKTRSRWGGFTGKWYVSLFQNKEIMNALYTTLIIALLSALIATLIGTLAALGMQVMRSRTRTLLWGSQIFPC